MEAAASLAQPLLGFGAKDSGGFPEPNSPKPLSFMIRLAVGQGEPAEQGPAAATRWKSVVTQATLARRALPQPGLCSLGSRSSMTTHMGVGTMHYKHRSQSLISGLCPCGQELWNHLSRTVGGGTPCRAESFARMISWRFCCVHLPLESIFFLLLSASSKGRKQEHS